MDYSKLEGLNVALHFARSGRFIFAIKYIEQQNPGIAREQAIAAVASFGYRERFVYSDNDWVGDYAEKKVRVL